MLGKRVQELLTSLKGKDLTIELKMENGYCLNGNLSKAKIIVVKDSGEVEISDKGGLLEITIDPFTVENYAIEYNEKKDNNERVSLKTKNSKIKITNKLANPNEFLVFDQSYEEENSVKNPFIFEEQS